MLTIPAVRVNLEVHAANVEPSSYDSLTIF